MAAAAEQLPYPGAAAVESRNLLSELPLALLERVVDPNRDLLGALGVHLSCKALFKQLDSNVWRRMVCAEAQHCGNGTGQAQAHAACSSHAQQLPACSWRALYLRQRPLCLRCEELVTSLDMETADLLAPRQHLIEGVLCHACWQEQPDLRLVWSRGMLAALHEPVPVIWSGWLRLMFLGRHCYHSAAITGRFLQICGMMTQRAGSIAGQNEKPPPQQPQPQHPQQTQCQTAVSAHAAAQAQPQRPISSPMPASLARLQQPQQPKEALFSSQQMPTNEHELRAFLLRLEQSKLAMLQAASPAQQGSKGLLTTAAAMHQALPRLAQYVQTGLDGSMPRAVAAVLARHAALLAALQRHGIAKVPSSHHSRLCAQFLAGMCAMEPADIAQKVAETRFLHQHTSYSRRQQELHAQVHWPDDEFDDVAVEGGGCYRLSWREAGEAAKQEMLQQYGGDYPRPWPCQHQSAA